MTCSQWAGLFSKRFCYTDPEFQASDPCMHDCIRTNIFVIYQGFWFLESRGSLLVLANVVKFPTWYSHSWNFTGPHSLEVWTETRWLMNDSTPPQTQPLYFWFTLLRVSGCVWLQSLILQRVCVCVLESWRKRAMEFNQVFSQVWPDSSPNTAAIRAAYPSEIFRVNNLYSSCYAPPKSCLSDTPSFMVLQVRDSATQSPCH